MKKGTIVALIVALLLLGSVVSSIGTYNGLVNKSVAIEKQWANVESKLQRRYDLIPNLVESVKGAMEQEKEVFGAIADARAKMAGAGTVNEKAAASGELESALSRLLVVMENYPTLKSSDNVASLMDELAGTENRISVERDRYNEAVGVYNAKIKNFPTVVIANITGFDEAVYFEAAEGTDVAPKVDFGN